MKIVVLPVLGGSSGFNLAYRSAVGEE